MMKMTAEILASTEQSNMDLSTIMVSNKIILLGSIGFSARTCIGMSLCVLVVLLAR